MILQGHLAQLLEEGPCELEGYLRGRVGRILADHFPTQAQLGEDMTQETVLALLQSPGSFPGDRIRCLPGAQRWLGRFAKSRVIDALRQARVIARLRCGTCAAFSVSGAPRCTLEFLPDHGEGLRPNPWWGSAVTRDTNPSKLDPRCQEFEWRRLATYDLFEQDVVAPGASGDAARDRVNSVVLAIERLASRSERGLREAVAIRHHYFQGRSVTDMAREAGISDRTVKRLLSSGRDALLEILRQEFVESMGEILPT